MAPHISLSATTKRASLLSALRRAMEQRGFLEVTTPVLLKVAPSGPRAVHPFQFNGHTYDLRTSIELLLRTALKAAPRVYDIGQAIRLEDKSKGVRSAAEFTLIECFAADLDYAGLIKLSEELLREVKPHLPPPELVSVVDWFAKKWSINFDSKDKSGVHKALVKILDSSDDKAPLWQLIDQVISEHLEPSLKGFLFLIEYPIETICLANRDPQAEHVAQRFEAYLNGVEVGHGFVDSSDPDDVLERMKQNGEQFVDIDFVEQLRAGQLPASAGFGLGIERLLAADDTDLNVHQYLHEYQHA
jgi:lysyl-tRNA synthetase class 2